MKYKERIIWIVFGWVELYVFNELIELKYFLE